MSELQPSVESSRRTPLSHKVARSLARVDSSGSVDSGLGQGMEMALTICVFLGLGWLIDRAAGTGPLFMVVLVVFAMIGQSARMWFTYDARMRKLEEERRRQSAGGSADRG